MIIQIIISFVMAVATPAMVYYGIVLLNKGRIEKIETKETE